MPTAKPAAVIDAFTATLGRINAAALLEYRRLTVAESAVLINPLFPSYVAIAATNHRFVRVGPPPDQPDSTTGPWTPCAGPCAASQSSAALISATSSVNDASGASV